jgi:hypothetical protein
VSERSAKEEIEEREGVISQLEKADELMRASGMCAQWFNGCDEETLAVTGQANGHLFEQLLQASRYRDVQCVELLREGA